MSVQRFLAELCVGGVFFLIYIYTVVLIHPTSIYAGAWPIFLFYVLVFASVFLMRIRIGTYVGFIIAIMAPITFSLVLLYFGEVTVPNLVDRGVPTLLGAALQFALSTFAVVWAVVLSSLIRSTIAKI